LHRNGHSIAAVPITEYEKDKVKGKMSKAITAYYRPGMPKGKEEGIAVYNCLAMRRAAAKVAMRANEACTAVAPATLPVPVMVPVMLVVEVAVIMVMPEVEVAAHATASERAPAWGQWVAAAVEPPDKATPAW
jgi:hypothetical protein